MEPPTFTVNDIKIQNDENDKKENNIISKVEIDNKNIILLLLLMKKMMRFLILNTIRILSKLNLV